MKERLSRGRYQQELTRVAREFPEICRKDAGLSVPRSSYRLAKGMDLHIGRVE